MLMKANHPEQLTVTFASCSGLWKVLRKASFCSSVFYLSLASPLELIRDLKRLSLRVDTHADAVYVFNMQSAVVWSLL